MSYRFQSLVRDIPDFPKPGIIFKDITPLLADPVALKGVVEDMAAPFKDMGIDLVLGMESRGFIFGPGVATLLGAGFAPVRKPGKLPYERHAITYDLEYGQDTLEIHVDALKPGQKVLIVDDLIATGGTAAATANLVRKLGGEISGFSFLIELAFLNGKAKLGEGEISALIQY